MHYTHPGLLGDEPARVHVAGAGGNGSQMLTRLARLHHTLVGLGGAGLDVVVYDPDTVSESNVGRQMFAPADVGRNKAIACAQRINLFFGLSWRARPEPCGRDVEQSAHLLIVCVDSRAARKQIRADHGSILYTLDMGNRAADGQVILGQPLAPGGRANPAEARRQKAAADHVALPDPYILFPELVDTRIAEDDTPSCSLAEAMAKQELFINDDVTTAAAEILWELFRKGRLQWHGAFINAAKGLRRPIQVDPAGWQRMSAPSTTTAPPKSRRTKK